MIKFFKNYPHYLIGVISSFLIILLSIVIFVSVYEARATSISLDTYPQQPSCRDLIQHIKIMQSIKNVENSDKMVKKDLEEIKINIQKRKEK